MQKLPVKVGAREFLPETMTKAQAQRYGERNMAKDLARDGFRTTVFESNIEIHGAKYFVINYGKTFRN